MWQKLLTALAILLLLMAAPQAQADDFTLTWILPTTWTDESPLDPLTDLVTSNMYCSHDGGLTYDAAVLIPIPGTELPMTLGTGDHQCAVTVIATNDTESDFSNMWLTTVLPPPNCAQDPSPSTCRPGRAHGLGKRQNDPDQ